MNNTLRSKTLTASLPGSPLSTFEWIAEPKNLPLWYGRIATLGARFVRDDRAHLLDLFYTVETIEVCVAIRLLPNGEGSEIVLTLIQPRGLPDAAFHEQTRWAESALAKLRHQSSRPAAQEARAPEDSRPETTPVPVTGKKLFVGNLPFAWTEDPLRELFTPHGTVAYVAIARLRGRGGRSRGFGFVEMSTEEEAQAAIDKLHETLAGERKIIVRRARSQENGRPGEHSAAAEPAESSPGNTLTDAAAPAAPEVRRPPTRGPIRRRGNAPRRGEPRSPRTPRPERAPRDSGSISNNSGYEIFTRGSKGSFNSEPEPGRAAPRSAIEPSPYFDDTGDIENRGNRPPRRRRR